MNDYNHDLYENPNHFESKLFQFEDLDYKSTSRAQIN
jgi:hypothetical protein